MATLVAPVGELGPTAAAAAAAAAAGGPALVAQQEGRGAAQRGPAAPATPARIEVWAWDPAKAVDVLAQHTGSAVSGDAIVSAAYVSAARTVEYYGTTFGRNSYDDRGAVLKLRVHSPDAVSGELPANNAYWFNDEGRIWLGDGDGTRFAPLGNAADVVAHEFAHGVIDAEVRLLAGWGQEGALHESFADVLATGIDGNWQIAEQVYTPGTPGDALRDLENPVFRDARNVPTWVTEAHQLADIPNHAAWRTASRIGGADMRRIWYTALVDKLRNHSDFAGARVATMSAARDLYGAGSAQLAAVRDAWDAVGVFDDTPRGRALSPGEKVSMRSLDYVQIPGQPRRGHWHQANAAAVRDELAS